MNYRHAFHAGNFADVVKHAVLARLVEYLKRKDAAFRVVDTHAGTGRYDLTSKEAQKTGEWGEGIGRLMKAPLDATSAELLAPYLDAVRAINSDGGLKTYPGSPLLVRQLLRKQDRLTAIELHPADAEQLRHAFEGDHQVRVIALDGWLALGAHLPPKEKRGLVLVDPPFEEPDEFARLAEGLKTAHRRWPGGIYALWYPIKDFEAVETYRRSLRQTGIERILDISLTIRGPTETPRLIGCGLTVVNPPFTLEEELKHLLPVLTRILAVDAGAAWSTIWLAREKDPVVRRGT